MTTLIIICVAIALVTYSILLHYGEIKELFFKPKKSNEMILSDIEILVATSKSLKHINNKKDHETLLMLLDSVASNKKSLSSFRNFLNTMKQLSFESEEAKEVQKLVSEYDFEKIHKDNRLDKIYSLSKIIFNCIYYTGCWIMIFCYATITPSFASIKGLVIFSFIVLLGRLDNIFKLIANLQDFIIKTTK